MPLSPYTVPGTYIVVTWQAETIEEYVYHVIAPQYRVVAMQQIGHLPMVRNIIKLGRKYVLDAIVPVPIAATGLGCRIREASGNDAIYALEHFDVAQLPDAITGLLEGKPLDMLQQMRDAFFEAADAAR